MTKPSEHLTDIQLEGVVASIRVVGDELRKRSEEARIRILVAVAGVFDIHVDVIERIERAGLARKPTTSAITLTPVKRG